VARLLADRGLEAFLPVLPRVRQWHDRETVVEFPLFPSYVFVRCTSIELTTVLTVPGLVTLVRFDGRPVVIPDWEIENIQRLLASFARSGEAPKAADMLERGEVVTVTAGPMAGVTGTVLERRRGGRIALVVGVTAIAQGLRIEVEQKAVEKRNRQGQPSPADTERKR
jgi:transcription antitermination factor NusG